MIRKRRASLVLLRTLFACVLVLSLGSTLTVLSPTARSANGVPRPNHVVVVIEENHSFAEIIGSPSAPYINSLAQQGALFTQSFAIEHPSQPNYLDLFSGSNQGVSDNTCPLSLSTPNLAAELTSRGQTFGGFSEDLPSIGWAGCSSGSYMRKHNPWVNFDSGPNALSASANLPLAGNWPTDFNQLPTVSIVAPNQLDDMHDGTILQGDTWLHNHLDAYVQFARTHNSLLIITFDEDDSSLNNQVTTIFVGPMVVAGQYPEHINHFSLLRTIEDMYGLGYAGASATAAPINDCWAAPTAASSLITGRIVAPDGSPVGGVVMQLSGPVSKTAITDANGNYHFDNVETGGFYIITPSLANYHFSPLSRSFSLVGNVTDAGFNATADADASANAIDATEYFVRQQYLDFLGREPDQGGFEYWTAQINRCAGDAACIQQRRIDVSAAFFGSVEFQQTGAFIYGLYAGTLGRLPAFGEFTLDRAQVTGDSGLDGAKTSFTETFVHRPEFTSRYPESMSGEQFVDALLQTMQLHSGVDLSSRRAGLLTDYATGGQALVARHAAEAREFVTAEYNRAFVLMEYFGYLRRDIDPGGYNFWFDVLNNVAPNNHRGMVCSFLTSTEYQRRFSPAVAHNNGECR